MNFKAAWLALREKPPIQKADRFLPHPVDVVVLYRKVGRTTYHTTPRAAFEVDSGLGEVRSYRAFRAGDGWYAFRGYLERVPVEAA